MLATVRNCTRCLKDYESRGRTLVCPACRKEPSSEFSPREKQLVGLLVTEALGNKELAFRLHLAEGTVKEYLNRIFRKLNVSSRTELIVKVHQNPGLTSGG